MGTELYYYYYYYSRRPLLLSMIIVIMLTLPCCGVSAAAELWWQSSPPEKRSLYLAFVKASCEKDCLHPSMCLEQLSPHADQIQGSKRRLAAFALQLSQAGVKAAKDVILRKLASEAPTTEKEHSAMSDCREAVGNAADGIKGSLPPLAHAETGSPEFGATMNDVLTWVSAALTDLDTCLDGLREAAAASSDLGGQVEFASNLTSISLAMITSFAALGPAPCPKTHQLFYNDDLP
ncbi:unnamed protein product [Cuscuta epithymum]|uniref:Pectinesterase inhibitor domain-containing protein n=1 Tax=Cuscuta epithymum TaxID=186058 RepID=A0AAV0G9A7_9ASTE|nr:unnamed protein product [Cuscuta epithymum]